MPLAQVGPIDLPVLIEISAAQRLTHTPRPFFPSLRSVCFVFNLGDDSKFGISFFRYHVYGALRTNLTLLEQSCPEGGILCSRTFRDFLMSEDVEALVPAAATSLHRSRAGSESLSVSQGRSLRAGPVPLAGASQAGWLDSKFRRGIRFDPAVPPTRELASPLGGEAAVVEEVFTLSRAGAVDDLAEDLV